MSDTDPTDEPDNQDETTPKFARDQIKRLNARVKELETEAASGKSAQRELTFAKAGIDLADKKFKYFVRGYDGDLTPEAIRAQAEEDGFLQAAAPQTPPSELQAHNRMDRAMEAAEPPAARQQAFMDEIAKAASPVEVAAVYERYADMHGGHTTWARQ